MRLLVQLVLNLVAVALLCLACAVGWIVVETERGLRAETEASAARVARDLERLYWRELLWRGGLQKTPLLPSPEWRTPAMLAVLAPGLCVSFARGPEARQVLCSQVEGVGRPAPDWFRALHRAAFGPPPAVARPLTVQQRDAGTVVATADPEAAIRQAWERVRVLAGVAAAMAAGISLLSALLIGRAVGPARLIVQGLARLEQGAGGRLPAFRAAEFRAIARAVDDLGVRLARTAAARNALTTRLFHVQEEERRALARDLHDEFGQCLTATGALAAAIEAGAADRPDLAGDARAITEATARMMQTLKGALARLRSQDVDDLGLHAALARLVAAWNARGTRARVTLAVDGDLAALPRTAALDLYRIAQECLTNAARHGRPRHVRVRVACPAGAVGLVVEDDGGGDPARLREGAGHGLLGIRERVDALGGRLQIGPAPGGVRVAVRIPVAPPLARAA
ncbi:sensor histidine kinase [Methylobacterium oryzisoli]|uniref:sensor histidine kinase n=1 Tax=Methylobacterium oryzisoli TaxID=3385502 RepID=UPI0039794FAE